MKILIRFFLSLAGLLGAGLLVFYFDPGALDLAGFAFFYGALIIGVYNLCLLISLTHLQSGLLTFLSISFLLLQQLGLFTFWAGAVMVIAVVAFEQYKEKKTVHS